VADLDEIRLEQAKKIEEETLWDCHEHDNLSDKQHIEECLSEMLAEYIGDERNYVVDGAEIECTEMCKVAHCIRYEKGKTKLYNVLNAPKGIERDYMLSGKEYGKTYYFGGDTDTNKVRRLFALHAKEASDNGIRFGTVVDRKCLRDVREGVAQAVIPDDGIPAACEANIISCGNCRIMRESDIAEIEKRWDESIEYGTCYSLIKPVAEWLNPLCAESVTGKCDAESNFALNTGLIEVGPTKPSCVITEHHKVLEFDTQYGKKEGLTMLSTLLCTRGGVITIKVHGEIYLDTYDGDLVNKTVTGAMLITDELLNPQGIPLYNGRTMNGKFTYFSLKEYAEAKYSNIVLTTDKTRLENRTYAYIHPIGKQQVTLPSSFNGNYHGVFTSNGNTFSMADNRIEIACRWGISTCDGEAYGETLAGKYIDIELSDGTVLACIMGASKGNEEGSDDKGVTHHDHSIFEVLETGDLEINANKKDIFHGCDIEGVYVYSEKRLYDSDKGEYTYYFSDGIDR